MKCPIADSASAGFLSIVSNPSAIWVQFIIISATRALYSSVPDRECKNGHVNIFAAAQNIVWDGSIALDVAHNTYLQVDVVRFLEAHVELLCALEEARRRDELLINQPTETDEGVRVADDPSRAMLDDAETDRDQRTERINVMSSITTW